MRTLIAVLLYLLSMSPVLNAQKEVFNYMDVFDLQMVANPEISPDGERIVYTRHQFDIVEDRRYTNLWQIDFDGLNHRPLTSGKSSYTSPVWSPVGDRIAYVSGEEGTSQIFVRWMDSGETVSITNLQHTPSGIQWSPDGEKLLFSMRIPHQRPSMVSIPSAPKGSSWASPPVVIEHVQYRADGNPGFVEEGYRQLFLISSVGGAARQLTKGLFNHNFATWAPEGRSILFTADTTGSEALDPNNAQIYEMDIESGEHKPLTDKRGPHNNPVVSPDGRYIAYAGYQDLFQGYQLTDIYLIGRDGGNAVNLTGDFNYDASGLQWSDDSRSVYFSFDQEGVSKVGNVDTEGNYTEVVDNLGSPTIGRPYGGGAYSVSENGRIAYPVVSAMRPAELTVSVVGSSETYQLTGLNDELFKSKKVGEVEEFWVESSVDDYRIHGWIITPPDFDPAQQYPLILEIHGGPYQNYGPRFSPELQLMASQGYVVVYTNPRGSTSYGSDFAEYINFNYPSEDYNDLMDAVDYVLNKGFVDIDKLFITGGSGGGVLTAWSIANTDRFAAAVVSKPVINWHSFAISSDMYPFFTKYWFKSMPWEDPDEYWRRSPLSLVGQVNTPTMLLTGESDFRTPMAESEQFYNALKLRGIDAALVRIPDSPHTIVTRPSNLIRKVGYIIGWFDRYH
jgi:dipeptidyl aminopeptidase/acylaminoacyl peptidase